MATETIDHATLCKLAEAGVVRKAHVVGQPGGWEIMIKLGRKECALAAQRSAEVRRFRKFETLVEYLKGLGIPSFDVDAVHFEARVSEERKRPDRASALKEAHESAAYSKWLKSETQASIDDPRPSIAHDQVMSDMRAELARMRKERA
jgi:hypothetical protein